MTLPGPFPLALRDLTPDNTALKIALEAARSAAAVSSGALAPQSVPVSLVEVVDNQTMSYAGANDLGMYFSGSLLKVAAMVGAFTMKQWVNDVGGITPFAAAGTLFSGLSTTADPTVSGAVKQLRNTPGLTKQQLVPNYSQIFTAPQPLGSGFLATCRTTFTPAFSATLSDMIVTSSDPSAAATIKALGFGWTMGVLKSLGFFDDSGTGVGVWLGGSYAGDGTTVARVPTLNDPTSAQATNTRLMARLFAQLIQATDLDATSTSRTAVCAEMFALLEKAQGVNASIFSPGGSADLGSNYKVLATKIGIGGLGPTSTGGTIRSEGTVIRHVPTNRRFIVVFQNIRDEIPRKRAFGAMVKRAIEAYLLATLGFISVP